MNFEDAIQAHGSWKLKLATYIRKPDGKYKATDVERDNVCELGCWLHGDGRRLASLSEYQALKASHARFHKAAGEIIRKADAGENMSDQVSLGANSAYAAASKEVVNAIMAMRRAAA